MPPVINVHTHFQPESVLPLVAPYGIEMTTGPDGKSWYFRSGSVEYLLPGGSTKFWGAGLGEQLEEMDPAGIDINVLQPSPMIFSYHLPPDVGATFSRAFNDEVAQHIEEHPTRFWGSAQLPMQDLELAAAELTRSVHELGMKSCSLGYVLSENRTLADPECDEFLSVVEELDVPILLHPVALGQDIDLKAGGAEWLRKYQVDWAWGYLFVETAARSTGIRTCGSWFRTAAACCRTTSAGSDTTRGCSPLATQPSRARSRTTSPRSTSTPSCTTRAD